MVKILIFNFIRNIIMTSTVLHTIEILQRCIQDDCNCIYCKNKIKPCSHALIYTRYVNFKYMYNLHLSRSIFTRWWIFTHVQIIHIVQIVHICNFVQMPKNTPGCKQKQKYRQMFETQKSIDKTSSGEICLNIRTLANPKVGQEQVSGGVSVYCWHATPVANVLWEPLAIR